MTLDLRIPMKCEQNYKTYPLPYVVDSLILCHEKCPDNNDNLIIVKQSECISFRKISTDLNIVYITIQNIQNKFVTTNLVVVLPQSGRPFKSTVRKRRLICLISKKVLLFKACEVATNFNMLQKFSVRTVRRYIRSAGLFMRMA